MDEQSHPTKNNGLQLRIGVLSQTILAERYNMGTAVYVQKCNRNNNFFDNMLNLIT